MRVDDFERVVEGAIRKSGDGNVVLAHVTDASLKLECGAPRGEVELLFDANICVPIALRAGCVQFALWPASPPERHGDFLVASYAGFRKTFPDTEVYHRLKLSDKHIEYAPLARRFNKIAVADAVSVAFVQDLEKLLDRRDYVGI